MRERHRVLASMGSSGQSFCRSLPVMRNRSKVISLVWESGQSRARFTASRSSSRFTGLKRVSTAPRSEARSR